MKNTTTKALNTTTNANAIDSHDMDKRAIDDIKIMHHITKTLESYDLGYQMSKGNKMIVHSFKNKPIERRKNIIEIFVTPKGISIATLPSLANAMESKPYVITFKVNGKDVTKTIELPKHEDKPKWDFKASYKGLDINMGITTIKALLDAYMAM